MRKDAKHEPYCSCQSCKPVFELRHTIAALERQKEARKAREEREKKAK